VFWGIGTGFSKTGIESSGGICTAVRESSGASVAKVAAHAAAGGTLNVLQGGKFGHGFLSAGVTEALSPAIGAASSGGGASGVIGGTVASAVIGGTVSELSGGKFGNGAGTGAFLYLFNSAVHELRDNKIRDAYVEYDGKTFDEVIEILSRTPSADASVHMTYKEFKSILDFQVDYVDSLDKALGGMRKLSDQD